MKIAVLGDGGWGTAISVLLSNKGLDVYLWGVFKDNIDSLNQRRENKIFLPGIKLSKDIQFTSDIGSACKDAEFIVLAIPSRFLREVLLKNKATLKKSKAIFISVVKGIEQGTLKRMSEVIIDVLGKVELSILSGPSIAPEVARGIPTAVTVVSENESIASKVSDVFRTDRFRVYTNKDMIGVELGGALKNIIAIAAGISDGLGFGTNTKSAILARGLHEISRLGFCMGASIKTFQGLSGLGDLFTTCVSREGRNRGFGEEIAKGSNPEALLRSKIQEIEGVWTAKAALELGKKYNIELPITQQVYSVIFENKSPDLAVDELMMREPKSE